MMWLKQFLSRRRVYRELSEEIQAHLDEKIEELVAGGMSREEAGFEARREFEKAAGLTRNGREREMLLKRAARCVDGEEKSAF